MIEVCLALSLPFQDLVSERANRKQLPAARSSFCALNKAGVALSVTNFRLRWPVCEMLDGSSKALPAPILAGPSPAEETAFPPCSGELEMGLLEVGKPDMDLSIHRVPVPIRYAGLHRATYAPWPRALLADVTEEMR